MINKYSLLPLLFQLFVLFYCTNSNSQIAKDSPTAIQFFKKADSLLQQKSFKKSIEYFKEARKIYKRNQDWEGLALSECKLSESYRNVFVLDKALSHVESALQICEHKIPENFVIRAKALDNLGSYYVVGKSDFDLAKKHYDLALELRTKNLSINHYDFAKSYFNLGTVYTSKGSYKDAISYFEKALDLEHKTNGSKAINTIEIYRQIGNVFFEQGMYDKTLEYLEKSIAIANEVYKPDNFHFVDLYNNIGLMYKYNNEYNRSLEYFTKSLHLSELHMGKNHPDQVQMHYNIGDVYYMQNNKEKALFHINKTINIGEGVFGADFPMLALPYSIKGLLIRGEHGITYIKKALDLARKAYGEQNVRTSYFYSYTSELYMEIGQYKKAIEYANKALDIRLKGFGVNSFYVVESYILMADIETKANAYDKALGYLEKAIMANNKSETSDLFDDEEFDSYVSLTRLLKSLEQKGLVLRRKYREENDLELLKESIDTYAKADRLIEVIRKTQYHKEDKITFAQDVKNVFHGGIATQLLRNSNKDLTIERAFGYAESSKANLLKELLNEANAKGFSELPEELLAYEKKLREELSSVKSKYYNLIGTENKDSTKVSEINTVIGDISRRQDSLKKSLEIQYPRYYSLKYDDNLLSISDVQKHLGEQRTLVEYFMADDKMYSFVITKNTANVKELAGEKINKKIKEFRSAILDKDKEAYKTLAYELYEQLLLPIKEYIVGNQLIIVPDESLWHLNFELLLTSDLGTSDYQELPYLLKDYAISYANSASLLFGKFLKEKESHGLRKECLAFSFSNPDSSLNEGNVVDFELLRNSDDDLPGTRKEIKSIANLVKGRYFYGDQAIERNFKNNISSYNVVHLALHGEVDHQNPDNSRIYFTKTKDSLEDNILYSHELYSLEIPAELTVLSACNTGMGKVAKGEGILSLGTAFQYAGTKSLLLTSWEVSDKTTPIIIQSFYSNLTKGMNKAIALQQAKLEYLETTDVFTKDPFYWGGFFLLGDYSTITFETPSTNNWKWFFLLGFLVIGIFFFLKRKLIR
ncbi:CHAT domain-containing protein [uncultured Aquimarina sp.]|uniref:CHAT domain-containing protein n=1 Tax=uncultured Aquimarina sp. TaxID=575652 RepID=UPI00261ECFC6|nr:CHAT domain-containing protein [uncultured Aquimarina sp.]